MGMPGRIGEPALLCDAFAPHPHEPRHALSNRGQTRAGLDATWPLTGAVRARRTMHSPSVWNAKRDLVIHRDRQLRRELHMHHRARGLWKETAGERARARYRRLVAGMLCTAAPE